MALKMTGLKKVVGPDDIPIQIWRCFGETRIVWVDNFLQQDSEKQQDVIGVEEKYANPFVQV